MDVTNEQVHRFAALYSGRTDAFGTGRGSWVRRPIHFNDYRSHLIGEPPGLGIAPLRDDGTVKFAAIDLDEPDFEAAAEMQGFIPGTAWIEESRSGNAHIVVFFDAPIDAWIVRGVLKEAILAAGKGAVEVFPKQDKLREGMVGNYINLPWYGESRPIQMQDAEHEGGWYQLDSELPQFLHDAEATLNSPDSWRKRAGWLGIVAPEDRLKDHAEFGTQKELHICAEWIVANRDENPISEGHRNVVYFNLAKMLCNYEGFDTDEAWHLMALVNDSAGPDRVPESELKRIFANASKGQFTSTGCDDPLMSPYVHPDCPIANRRP